MTRFPHKRRIRGDPPDRGQATYSWTPTPIAMMVLVMLVVSLLVGVIVGSSESLVGFLSFANLSAAKCTWLCWTQMPRQPGAHRSGRNGERGGNGARFAIRYEHNRRSG